MKLLNLFLHSFLLLNLNSPILGFVAGKKVTQDGYRVEIFECDDHLDALSTEHRQRKVKGSSYRICFKPNEKALEDGVAIERIDHFQWELHHKRGVVEQEAVVNGQGDNLLTILSCEDDGKICFLDSMLTVDFYIDGGSVLGYGEASLTGNRGKVEMERYLFPHDFKFTVLNPDGTEMTEDELADFRNRLEAQETDTIPDEKDEMQETTDEIPVGTKQEEL